MAIDMFSCELDVVKLLLHVHEALLGLSFQIVGITEAWMLLLLWLE